MARLSLTNGVQTVTATGPVYTAGGAIATITGDYTIHLRVTALTAVGSTPSASVVLEDTVNAFSATQTQNEIQLTGPIGTNGAAGALETRQSWRKYQVPGLRAGQSNAALRLNVTTLNGITPSMTLESWFEPMPGSHTFCFSSL